MASRCFDGKVLRSEEASEMGVWEESECPVFALRQLGHLIREDIAFAGLERLAEAAPLTVDAGPVALNDFGRVAHLEATRYLRNQLLRDWDCAGMAHSLEIRVLLVDAVVTERVIGVAATGWMPDGKAMLAEIVPAGLPPAIVNRPKTGFSIPIWLWLHQSAAATAWKRNRFLAHHNVGAYSRWAYCMLASRPETAEALL